MQGLPSYGRLTFHGLGGSLRLAQKIIAGNPAKNLVIRRLVIIKHRVDTTLPTKIGQRPEEAGLTQIKPVMLTIVGSAIPHLADKLPNWQPYPATRVLLEHTAQWISESLWPCSLITITPYVRAVSGAQGRPTL